jgi:hypothetical protein
LSTPVRASGVGAFDVLVLSLLASGSPAVTSCGFVFLWCENDATGRELNPPHDGGSSLLGLDPSDHTILVSEDRSSILDWGLRGRRWCGLWFRDRLSFHPTAQATWKAACVIGEFDAVAGTKTLALANQNLGSGCFLNLLSHSVGLLW